MTTPIAPGDGMHSVELGGEAVDVFTWRPAVPPRLLLVVFHGMHADADNYRDRAVPLAETLDAIVVAPKFGHRASPCRSTSAAASRRRACSSLPASAPSISSRR